MAENNRAKAIEYLVFLIESIIKIIMVKMQIAAYITALRSPFFILINIILYVSFFVKVKIFLTLLSKKKGGEKSRLYENGVINYNINIKIFDKKERKFYV